MFFLKRFIVIALLQLLIFSFIFTLFVFSFNQRREVSKVQSKALASVIAEQASYYFEENNGKFSYNDFFSFLDNRIGVDKLTSAFNVNPPELLTVYFRSDISNYFGLESMVVTHLRDDASSTRVYCKNCYSCIAVDHTNYHNNVFMIQPDYCKQNFNDQISPKAVINLQDHPEDFIELDSDTTPVFHSRKYPQERKRFLSIDPLSEFLAPPKTPAIGTTIKEIISKIVLEEAEYKESKS